MRLIPSGTNTIWTSRLNIQWGGLPSKIEDCLSYPCPTLSEILPLKDQADKYLHIRKLISDWDRDVELNKLIREADNQLRAFLACVHALSKLEVEMWLITIKRRLLWSSQSLTYLDIILLIEQLNPVALQKDEFQYARNLKHLLQFNETYLTRMAQIGNHYEGKLFAKDAEACFKSALDVMEDPPTTKEGGIFWPEPLKEVPKKFFLNAQDLLFHLPMPYAWELTAKFAQPLNHNRAWVSMIVECGDPNLTTTWSAWSSWKPNLQNMGIMCALPNQWLNNATFKWIFDFEGPDFQFGKYGSFLECHLQEDPDPFSVKRNSLTVVAAFGLPLREVVNMLFQLLEKASQMLEEPIRNGIALSMIEKTLRAGIDISAVHIRVLSTLLDNDTPLETLKLFEKFFTRILPSRKDQKAATLSQILHALEPTPKWTAIKTDVGMLVGPIVSRRLEHVLNLMRTALQSRIDVHDIDIKGATPYIEILKEYPWVEKFVEAYVWKAVHNIPSLKESRLVYRFNRELYANTPDHQGFHSLVTRFAELKLLGMSSGNLSSEEHEYFDVIFEVYSHCDTDHTNLVCKIASWVHIPMKDRIFITAAIIGVSKVFAQKLLVGVNGDHAMFCVHLARTLAMEEKENVKFWTHILELLIQPLATTILESTAVKLEFTCWINWLRDLQKLFNSNNVTLQLTGLLHERLQSWATKLNDRKFCLVQLSGLLGQTGPLMKQIYTAYDFADEMLCLLDQVTRGSAEYHALCKLLISGSTLIDARRVENISLALKFVQQTNVDPKFVAINRLLLICKISDQSAMKGLLLVWWQDPTNIEELDNFMQNKDRFVQAFAHLQTDGFDQECVHGAAQYLQMEHEAILLRIDKLQKLRTALKFHNPDKTTDFLDSHGLKDSNSILYIPEDLADYVDEIDMWTYDVYFPLGELKPMQKLALGVGNAQNLIVQVEISKGFSNPTFQVRLDREDEEVTVATWGSLDDGDFGDELDMRIVKALQRPSRVTYTIMRLLLHNFRNGFDSIEDLYDAVLSSLTKIDQCVICLQQLSIKVWQSTTCRGVICLKKESWRRIQLSELCPQVLDLYLLSSMNVEIQANRELLPECPITCQNRLRTVIYSVQNPQSVVKAIVKTPDHWVGTETYDLLTYLASFRFFLAQATGVLRIPSLPKVHQFVVFNSSPEVEALRSRHTRITHPEDSQVVFHGTSVDRLFAILSEGLKTLSGTNLQRHGAAHGRGVYCATELATALSYATAANRWSNTSFEANLRLVIGCELVGMARHTSRDGIIVVDDATQLSVRYLFLFPQNAWAPESRFIVPAMKSAFGLLRAGTV